MHSEVMISLVNSPIFSIQYDYFCTCNKKFCFQVILPIICTDQATTAPGWPNISLGPDGRPDRIDTTPITLTDSNRIRLALTLEPPSTSLGMLSL